MYIGGIDHIHEDELRRKFKKAGNIVSLKLMKKYGFVTYDTHESAVKAISLFNIRNVFGDGRIKV